MVTKRKKTEDSAQSTDTQLPALVALFLSSILAGCMTNANDPVSDEESEPEFSILASEETEMMPLTKAELAKLRECDLPGSGTIQDCPSRNTKAAAMHGLLQLRYDGLIGTGEGLMVGVWDGGGVLPSHQEFAPDRVLTGPDIDRVHWHATHVAGTLAATGSEGFEEARGMVPDAQIYSMDFCGNVRDEIAAAYRKFDNIAVTNHSYAESRTRGRYTSGSTNFDNLVFYRPETVVVVAGGNSGCVGEAGVECVTSESDGREYGTIDAPGTAKNVITVGSMSDLPYGLEVEKIWLLAVNPLYGDIPIEPYSGVGPTRDGRIKPDVVANGQQLFSPFSNPSESSCHMRRSTLEPERCDTVGEDGAPVQACYKRESGTSMATPTTSGIVTVLQEIALQGDILGRLLNAAEVRALLVHTAVSVDARPKYKYGWGAISVARAVEHIRQWSIKDDATKTSHYIALEQGAEDSTWLVRRALDRRGKPVPARITLVWNDKAGRELRTDLDVSISSLEGENEILPWTLDPENPTRPAARGINNVDNLERIDLFDSDTLSGNLEIRLVNNSLVATDAVLLISGFEILDQS